jgi:response regulator RpfG family c-di-GMP phosphodiesterase
MGQHYKNLDEDKTTDHRKKRILFVNDDPDTRAVMKKGLTHHGFEVEAFEVQNRHCRISKRVCMICYYWRY